MFPKNDQIERLGSPDISLAGLQIWVHGRQFPNAQDYWDGNWLNVTAHCGAEGADVWISGPRVHLSEVLRWRDEAVEMHRTLSGKAELSCMEPELAVELKMASLGHVAMIVRITPNLMAQQHSFEFTIDQSHLPGLLRGCGQVLQEYPIRDPARTVKV
ncbi:MAG TPA: hypothetical protein VLX67_09650 [Stellaceae bacterium]|nr:hypothetical protein [Stellaceae bacterium]